mgnify:FL=1
MLKKRSEQVAYLKLRWLRVSAEIGEGATTRTQQAKEHERTPLSFDPRAGMAPSSEPSNKLVSLGKSTPITALAFLAPALLLAGSSSDLLLIALDACGEGADTTKREWRVLERERVHRIVVQPATRGTESWRVLVLGGKEAALVELARGASGRGDGETRYVRVF